MKTSRAFNKLAFTRSFLHLIFYYLISIRFAFKNFSLSRMTSGLCWQPLGPSVLQGCHAGMTSSDFKEVSVRRIKKPKIKYATSL